MVPRRGTDKALARGKPELVWGNRPPTAKFGAARIRFGANYAVGLPLLYPLSIIARGAAADDLATTARMLPDSLRASATLAIIVAAAASPLTSTGAWARQQQQHARHSPAIARSLGVPEAGDYTGALRPQHAYYQHNPTRLSAGNQHWGHATSRDLYHWENQPEALSPPPRARASVLSGSVVTDPNNTPGFFLDRDSGVVAVFTLAEHAEDDGTPGTQTQALAYSLDGGYSFRHYDGNPAIDGDDGQLRDPKVVRHENRWVMVLAYAREPAVGIYSSPDLRHWTHESNFSRHGPPGAQWESPNLVQCRGRVGDAVLPWRVQRHALFALGRRDAHRRLRQGNYAAKYFYGLPEGSDAVGLGWASNWQYAERVPMGQLEGWRGGFTLPRVHYLAKAPRVGGPCFDGGGAAGPGGQGDGRTAALGPGESGSGAYYIDANVTGLDAARLGPDAQLNFSLSSPSTGEALRWGIDFGGGMASGSTGLGHALYGPGAPAWRMQAVVDRSIFEVFVDGGIHAATVLILPASVLNEFEVKVGGLSPDARVSIAVNGLESVWKS
ncbi:inulinase [Gaeumannomyces tritici R3-111a-1]|uniref:Inulinase n=1 Tax=Gaeumannomyces tritici (strain R3-111a-1) TaxID=644352 RepID=J3NMG6_GAET3|nr:inulinase [Gaeumannomyces tritici R3-111a-1]EJT82497.1 inulinase [Gaeumannomyces tritici R3-111a-1]